MKREALILRAGKSDGVTLVELIVVIAVMAILAAAGIFFLTQGFGMWSQQALHSSLEGQLMAVEERVILDLRPANSVSISPGRLSFQSVTATGYYVLDGNSLFRNVNNGGESTIANSISSFTPTLLPQNVVQVAITASQSAGGKNLTLSSTFSVKLRGG